ncbi:hypothetical protein L1887_30297 [Cichorium endivia]|nr:hypothetical protein L1887_30297 [Cichorium endivia]
MLTSCFHNTYLLEGNHWIHKETSYGNVPDWRPEFNHQNELSSEHFNLVHLNTKSSKSNDCEKEGWQENLSKTYPYCDDHDHLEKRECVGHTHGDHASSPCMVKRCTTRALLTSPDELSNSYHRPTRKLVELTGPIVLIGVVVTTAVVTLGVFVLVLICCLGRDALKPAAKQQKEDNKQEKDKLVVNLSPKASKDELGHIRVSHLICLVSFTKNNERSDGSAAEDQRSGGYPRSITTPTRKNLLSRTRKSLSSITRTSLFPITSTAAAATSTATTTTI